MESVKVVSIPDHVLIDINLERVRIIPRYTEKCVVVGEWIRLDLATSTQMCFAPRF